MGEGQERELVELYVLRVVDVVEDAVLTDQRLETVSEEKGEGSRVDDDDDRVAESMFCVYVCVDKCG